MKKKVKRSLAFFLTLVLMLGVFNCNGTFTSAEEPTEAEEIQVTEDKNAAEQSVVAEQNEMTEKNEVSAQNDAIAQEEASQGQATVADQADATDEKNTADQKNETAQNDAIEKEADQAQEDASDKKGVTEQEDATAKDDTKTQDDAIAQEDAAQTKESEKISVQASNLSVQIQDDIKNTGSLTADVTGASDADKLSYQWYESSDGQNWTKIEDSATVDSKEASYYVARNGARKYFKVQVSMADQTVKSDAFQVSYYDSLQNGSFETPVVSAQSDISQFGQSHFIQIPNGTEGLEWKTSALGQKWPNENGRPGYYIEIADGSNKFYNGRRNNPSAVYKISGAADGDQFAELNCQTEGALYQDILTQPGAKLYWSLEHAGRDGEDTMAVIISDTKSLPADWNPSASNYDSRPEDVKAVLTDPAKAWSYHSGTYQVPEGQYVTRFYFVAVAAAGGRADGNLLDDIHFGKEVPTPSAQTGNLTVSKSVEGLDAAKVPAETFSFDVVNASGTVIDTVKLPTVNGEWSDTLISLEPGTYTVTEHASDISGYRLADTKYQIDQGNAVSGTSAQVGVYKKSTSQISYTNRYEAANKVLTVAKEVKGNMGDRNHTDFTFTMTLKKDGVVYQEPVSAVKNNSGTAETINADTSGNYTFSLKNKEQIALTLPDGVEYTLVENALDYQVKIDGKDSKDGKTTGILDADKKIQYTNTKNISAPTGVRRMTFPYVILLFGGIGMAGVLFALKKREEECRR